MTIIYLLELLMFAAAITWELEVYCYHEPIDFGWYKAFAIFGSFNQVLICPCCL